MNTKQISGICRQLLAKINEYRGELTGDPSRVAAARRAWIVAKNEQRITIANEESKRQLREFLRRNRNWNFRKQLSTKSS